jgi:hypothetical protein
MQLRPSVLLLLVAIIGYRDFLPRHWAGGVCGDSLDRWRSEAVIMSKVRQGTHSRPGSARRRRHQHDAIESKRRCRGGPPHERIRIENACRTPADFLPDCIHGQQTRRRLRFAAPVADFADDGDDDLLRGGPGNDGITADHFRVSAGEIAGDGGDDRIEGGPGDDTIFGDSHGVFVTVISGADGDDEIEGGGGPDVIFGESSANQAVTRAGGNDTIIGGAGNDAEIVGDHRAANPGPSGDDALFGNSGNDGLHGDRFLDGTYSGTGNDHCDGGAGTDTAALYESVTGVP